MADIDISALCALAGQAVADLVEAVDAGACPTVSRKATFGQIVDVITGDITVNACGVSALAACSVAAAEITNCTVGTAELAACSVTATEIAACAVGTSEIAACGVGASEIAANAVGSSELADCAVDTNAIVNDAVTLAKMATGTDGNLISYDACTNPVAVATGTACQILTSNGAGAAPTFQAAGGGGCCFISAVKTADTTRTCCTTFSDDPHLKVCLDACSRYVLTGLIDWGAHSTPDIKWRFTAPTGSTARWTTGWPTNNSIGFGPTCEQNTTGSVVTTHREFNWTAFVITTCAGAWTQQWAQKCSSSESTTMFQGSSIIAKKL